MERTPLPIDPLIPSIVQALEERNAAVVTAEPGAGKTTRVPPALLSSAFARGREIWVLQPRRIAAKLAALRVARELGEEPGMSVGYHFRFERCAGEKTRLKFLTDGMLIPLAQADPGLGRVAAVVLDEFHERSLALELGLAFLHRLQMTTRPDLRILVMSATLDAGPLSSYLSDCPVFRGSGRVFPVDIEFLPQPEQPDLSLKVRAALRRITDAGRPGTTLVFLPGQAEIRRASRALEGLPVEVRTLYGDLPVSEQQRVLEPGPERLVILSTNVAETSLTVPGVTAVVDSGLTRQARISPWSGLTRLVTVTASQASAAQRAGRAGRLQEGVCLRLYSKFDFEHRAAFDVPEILRSDLSQVVLDLKCLGVDGLEDFPWFLEPPDVAQKAALLLLRRLGALDGEDRLTDEGRRMARFPLPPRLARFLLAVEGSSAKDPHVMRSACRMAALVSGEKASSEDLLEEWGTFKPGFEAQRLERQLTEMMGAGSGRRQRKPDPSGTSLLAKGLLAAFPDRVARLRPGDGSQARNRTGRTRELLLSAGGSAVAGDSALLRSHEYFVMVDAQEMDGTPKGRGDPGAKVQARARSLCPIEVDWLLDLFPGELSEEEDCEWNAKAGRVEGYRRLKYGQLALDEKPLAAGQMGPRAAELLLKQALASGAASYCDPEELAAFRNRVGFVGARAQGFPAVSDDKVQETLAGLCRGCRSLEELRGAGLVTALSTGLSPQNRSLLERLAPTQVTLKTGRRVAVHYEAGQPPWVESRLQDFFGMSKGPTVAGGQVPLVMRLLAPSKRPVQITDDLAGFWRNHYPQVRQELMRRYPKHKWPEHPL